SCMASGHGRPAACAGKSARSGERTRTDPADPSLRGAARQAPAAGPPEAGGASGAGPCELNRIGTTERVWQSYSMSPGGPVKRIRNDRRDGFDEIPGCRAQFPSYRMDGRRLDRSPGGLSRHPVRNILTPPIFTLLWESALFRFGPFFGSGPFQFGTGGNALYPDRSDHRYRAG